MREIKFRAWDKESKFMLKIFDNTTQEDWYIPQWKDRHEVMQFTGLRDKNGKEIYESDIVKLTNERGFSSLAEVHFVDGCFEVKFQKGLSVFEGIHYQYTRYRDYVKVYVANHAIEVIGNIYENPELLVRID